MNQITDAGAIRISASAGSGKTYSLTRLFIQRALQFPTAYTGIVAITFTNKAANELKERVVSRLKELTNPDRKPDDVDLFGFDDRQQLADRARQVLQRLLHDFDNLKVTTIDSFFQSVFSQLAYEANLPPGLKSEVDLTLIRKEVLEEGIRSMGEIELKVLVQNLTDQLNDKGKDWRVVANLRNHLLSNLFEEKVIRFQMDAQESDMQDERIVEARKKLQTYKHGIEVEIRDSAGKVQTYLDSIGLSPSKLDPELDKNYVSEYTNIRKAAAGTEIPKSTPKSHREGKLSRVPKSRLLSDSEKETLAPLLILYGEAKEEHNLANHSLAKELIRNLSSIRLLVFFRNILQMQNRRNNRIILGEIKYILDKMIGNSEVPFLFERMGTQIHTMLIDEFQDTDKIQWNVLLPLCKHVVESNGLLAVVGDVKQSIYGWRGADSTLFKEGIEKTMAPIPVVERNLGTNFRSEACIVEFNNWVFKTLSDSFAKELLMGEQVVSDAGWEQRVRRNYEDVKQEVNPDARNRSAGFVELRVRRKMKKGKAENTEEADESQEEDDESTSMPWLVAEIKKLQDAGFKASDIAILVRKNSVVLEVVEILDAELQKRESGYDFRFSTSLMGKAGELPLYRFLILALQNCQEAEPDRFVFEEMEQIARTLGLDSRFYPVVFPLVPDWRAGWLSLHDDPSVGLLSLFFRQVAYFGLNQIVALQNDLQEFQNLLFLYIQQDSAQYPDFFEWWADKASEKERVATEMAEGIRVMTIHKSKGLDFGVVIIPMASNPTGDSVHRQAVFWPEGEEEPWNAYPILKADAKSEILKSDLALQYQEDVYRRSLENLNNLYVAFTRPRIGLIIDLSVESSFDLEDKKAVTKGHRLSYKLPGSLKNAFENGSLPFENCRLEVPNEEVVLHFSFGNYEKTRVPEKPVASIPVAILTPVFPHSEAIPWASPPEQSFEVKTGILVHRILELTESADQWPDLIREEVRSTRIAPEIAEVATRQLENLFSFPEFQEWFSGKYMFYPEQQMVSEKGEILRADRLLMHADKLILLDYKTGEELDSHVIQIRKYTKALQSATGKSVEAFLVYSSEQKIVPLVI